MFIAFDGIDGAGKSTQVEMLSQALTRSGIGVVQTHLAAGLFRSYIDPINADPRSVAPVMRELLYYFAALHANVTIVLPNAESRAVITDRYYLSFLAYGQLNGMPREHIRFFTEPLVEPDYYFILDIPPEQAFGRIIANRGQLGHAEIGFAQASQTPRDGRSIEAFVDCQTQVRAHYRAESKASHIWLDGSSSADQVHASVMGMLASALPDRCRTNGPR